VVDGERLRVQPFNGWEAERKRLARQYRPIVEARWRVLDAAPSVGMSPTRP
jgi:hypothetical protein